MSAGAISLLVGWPDGILLMRDRRVVAKIEVRVGEYVVACSFRNVEDDFA